MSYYFETKVVSYGTRACIALVTGMHVCIFMTLMSGITTAFNFDTRLPFIRTPTAQNRDAMFGFSVALHKHRSNVWLLVGSPRAQTRQPGVRKGGAVFACRMNERDCRVLEFDEHGPNFHYNGSAYANIDKKSHQWFASAIYSCPKTGVIVACAPRYVYFTRNLRERQPVGNCRVQGVDRDFSPCRQGPYGYNKVGYCQSGFSVALSASGDLLMGAVGSYYWQGQVFQQNVIHDDRKHATTEGPLIYDNTYMGYAITLGEFDGLPGDDFAVSIPKADGLKGRVAIFTMQMKNIFNFTGEQAGEYFGYSLAVSDFNGDGYDDIAVGAPFYADYSSGYECGRVYVHYQNSDHTFGAATRTFLKGSSGRLPARFGLSVSKVGDSDIDGYQDLAVGAPYDGPDGRGAVYIFRGSKHGINSAVSQVIHAHQIAASLATFGFSLSGGLDMDGNRYTDLLVGAYQSNTAVLLRSRPVFRVTVTFTLAPEVINLEKKACPRKDDTPVVCFSVLTCLTFSGLNVPDVADFELAWAVDSQKSDVMRRASFAHSNGRKSLNANKGVDRRIMAMHKSKEKCVGHMVHVKDEFRDKLTPIFIRLNYSVPDQDPLPRRLTAVIENSPGTALAKVNIHKFCGTDDVCIPNLAIIAKSKTKRHLLGTAAELVLAVRVRNLGEDAYESVVYVLLPAGVSYVNIRKVPSSRPVTCSSPVDHQADLGGRVVVCDIGNPLSAQEIVRFRLRLDASDISGHEEMLNFQLNVTSANGENSTDYDNNAISVDIPVVVETAIHISGISKPEQVFYNSSDKKDLVRSEVDLGPKVIHLYEVRNTGSSSVSELSVNIDWPDELLYLPTAPLVVRGEGICHVSRVNPFNLSIDDVPEKSRETYENFILERKNDSVIRELRLRRDANRLQQRDTTKDELLPHMRCSIEILHCAAIRCDIKRLDKDTNVLVQVTSRVVIPTATKIRSDDNVLFVTSQATAVVRDVPYDIKPRQYATADMEVTSILVALDVTLKRPPIEIWVIIVGIVGGWSLLLLLVALMWRCGFFKRNKSKEVDDFTRDEDRPIEETTPCLYQSVPDEEL